MNRNHTNPTRQREHTNPTRQREHTNPTRQREHTNPTRQRGSEKKKSAVRSQKSEIRSQRSDTCPNIHNSEFIIQNSAIPEPERYELFESPRYHFAPDRRDFLKVLGGGVVICLVAGHAQAQQKGGRGKGGNENRGPQQIGGWLHIAEDGQITLYCGKTEVGQNVRTSVTQAAAEELKVSPQSIRTVLADTDLVPDDGGTSGSRSTPSTVPQIRRVAAAARELLLDLAAEQLQVSRDELTIGEAKVSHAKSGRSLTFGQLTKGQKITREVTSNVSLTPAKSWKILGTSTPKIEARALVTGSHQFASDIHLPGLLHGRVLRAPSVGAKLASVDVKGAQAVAGVTVVHDGDFVGVAAPTSRDAAVAVTKITAQWTPSSLPPTSKTLFADLKRGQSSPGGGKGGNNNDSVTDDALEAALKSAARQFKATYTIAYIAHAPLEPRAAVAQWQEGKLTVWTGTQQPFRVRGELAQAFGIPAERVRVIVPDTGSGYGGKHTGEAAVEAARLAKTAGKPVKLVWSREEEFKWAYFRPAGVIEVKSAMTEDGKITAWDFHNYNSGGSAVRALYDIPQQRAQFHATNSPLRPGSYRSLAATANHFARETHIDEMASAIGMDPLEFRLKNLKDERLRAVLEAAAKEFGWEEVKPRPNRGIGLACGSDKGSYVATCAEVAVNPSTGKTRVVRATTAFECGAVLNPDHLINQIEGAVVQGLGGALFEAIEFDAGKIQNAAFSSYRVPRFSDLPRLETVLVNRPDLPSVGAGETPIVAIAPAVGNAIFKATGRRALTLPMSASGVKS